MSHYDIVIIDELAAYRGYAPKLDVCEKLHDASEETQKPRSIEADSRNVPDSDGENLHVEQDTREKLEADVWSGCDHLTLAERGETLVNVPWSRLLGWLDRQAAIAEREARARLDRKPTDAVREFAERYETRIEERDKRIAELEAELHRSYAAQAAKAEELTSRGVRIAELQKQTKRQAEAIGEWEIRCEALIAERNKWHVRCGKLLDAAHVMLGVTDEWDEEV